VSTQKRSFTIRATASRLEKGLLAIPQRFREWFPPDGGQIRVVFDDEEKPKALTFHPYDPVTKENRIFGLGNWFSKRDVREGDLLSITVEDGERRLYRVALDRYVQQRQEQKARRKLESARTDSEAEQELGVLSRLTRRRPRDVAREELLRIAQSSERQARVRIIPPSGERHEGVPSGIRVLLREVHGGRCQLCAFTFEKRNGEPYFEIHHLDPKIGHHPTNLLVVCPNCHAQLEHAAVTDLTRAADWLICVTVNGKRVPVRQPFARDWASGALLSLVIAVAASHFGRLLLR
jgi:hypothetical protein